MQAVVVIGAGAAGYFAAIHAAQQGVQVILLEKSQKPLAKVAISGGGRCNVTHQCFDAALLSTHYPRGGATLQPLFKEFGPAETIHWFEERGVPIKAEADGRMFPTTDNSQTIIKALQAEARRLGVQLRLGEAVRSISIGPPHTLHTNTGSIKAGAIIIATGGSPSINGMAWLQQLGLEVVPPVPSLFTFNMPRHGDLCDLAGVSVPSAMVNLPSFKLSQMGGLLITHWGLSGPAVLKLSAWAARELAGVEYQATVQVNWAGQPMKAVLQLLKDNRDAAPSKQLSNLPIEGLPRRLWEYLYHQAQLPARLTMAQTGNKHLQALAQAICQSEYVLDGKTTFKEEFVTSGGIALHEVDFSSMALHRLPGVFACGEVLDIDAVTGGFNFQAAWTTGRLAGLCAGSAVVG